MCAVAMTAAYLGGCSVGGSSGGSFAGSIPGIKMDSIPAGTFQMGSADVEAIPVHSVTLGAFTMSQTLVTQNQFDSVMGGNSPSFFSGGTHPVEQVTWERAVQFCNKLSNVAKLDTVYSYTRGNVDSGLVINYHNPGYRLPTEAEFEYASRAGSTDDYYWGRNYPLTTNADTLALDSNAVWGGNSSDTTAPVGSKLPNAFGLYDMSGNVWEWCNDWSGPYADSSQTNPTGPTSGSARVVRGGSWQSSDAGNLSSAYRSNTSPGAVINTVGFRVVIGVR
jgi:formylglycine-generating enzyme required for sulfatase activity